ncbi:hypothetical protein ACHAPE_004001 [Trichoderma viride]
MDPELLTLLNLQGNLRLEALRLVDQIFRDLQTAFRDPRGIDEYQTDAVIGDALHNREKELAAVEKLVGIIVQEWHAIDINISRKDFEFELAELEARAEHLMGDILVIRDCRFELGGRLLDDVIGAEDGGSISSTWSHVDSLIERYKTAKGAKIPICEPKGTIAQWNFCKTVFKEYDVEDGSEDWCVISGQRHLKTTVRGAQIVRYNLGEKCARYLFALLDDSHGHLFGAKNGLPMQIRYAEALENGRLVIIPDEVQVKHQERNQEYIGRWKVYNLYEADTQKRSDFTPLGSELHGRSLQFRNDFRPDARYLFFVFCINVLQRQRHEASGWWRVYLACGPGQAWAAAASGPYLRSSTLRRIAQRVGRLNEEEASQFVVEAGNGPITEPSDGDRRVEERDSFYQDLCFVAAMQPSPNQSPKWMKLGPYNQSHEDVFGDYEGGDTDDEESDEFGAGDEGE